MKERIMKGRMENLKVGKNNEEENGELECRKG